MLQHLYREISRLVSLGYPSKETEFTDHVGKEAFIRALNDGPLQLEVMKGEPINLESALNYATKYEAYECSLVSQGTLSKSSAYVSISDEDRPKRRSRAVNAVQDEGKDAAPSLSVGELQDLLAQATKGIAALATSPERLTRASRARGNRLLPRRIQGPGILDGADTGVTQVKSRIPMSIHAITAVK